MVTATFRLVCVLLIMEIGARRILHVNVTQHPTALWTRQQFRECVSGDEGYRFIIHDRDSIYSRELDSSLRTMGLRVLRTPYRSPQANAFCERLKFRELRPFLQPLARVRVISTVCSSTEAASDDGAGFCILVKDGAPLTHTSCFAVSPRHAAFRKVPRANTSSAGAIGLARCS
jgi:hypothetical protein